RDSESGGGGPVAGGLSEGAVGAPLAARETVLGRDPPRTFLLSAIRSDGRAQGRVPDHQSAMERGGYARVTRRPGRDPESDLRRGIDRHLPRVDQAAPGGR